MNGQITTSKPSSTSSSSASATSSAAASTPSKSSSNTGAIAGGAVGGVVGLLFVIGALWWFQRRRKRAPADSVAVQQSQRPHLAEMDSTERQTHELVGSGVGYKKVRQSSLGGGGMVEVPGRYELDAAAGREELSG